MLGHTELLTLLAQLKKENEIARWKQHFFRNIWLDLKQEVNPQNDIYLRNARGSFCWIFMHVESKVNFEPRIPNSE